MKRNDEEIRRLIEKAHLKIMGITSTDEINRWYIKARNDEYRIDYIQDVCDMIMQFRDKHIYIMGDYDVDGISASAIMIRGLQWADCKNIHCRLPKRVSEGYGMCNAMIDEVEYPGSLIITVDNGIAALETVSYAKSMGHTVIVTDHHEPKVENGTVILPEADYVIDPKAIPGSADFDGYCGAGIAYKIVKRLLKGDRRIALLTPIVALATICDQMKIIEENYYFVRDGLAKLNMTPQCTVPGITAIGNVMGVSHWDSNSFGFTVGPAVNAPERLKDGMSSLSLRALTSNDVKECQMIALELKRYNEERKMIEKKAVEETAAIIGDDVPYPLIVYIKNLVEGIVGIVAGQVANKYDVPAAVFTDSSDPDILKGSFRTFGEYNVKEHMDICGDMFTKYGGHAEAAGASVRRDLFEDMRHKMEECSERPAQSADERIPYDVEIDNEETPVAVLFNEKFQPFGNGNRNLIFKINNFKVIPYFGAIKKHIGGNGIKLHSMYSDAVGFGLWDLGERITGPVTVTLYGELGLNRYNGKTTIQITVKHIEY